MDKPQQTLPVRGHVRNKSSVARATRPRSSTKGPLDEDDIPVAPPVPVLSPTPRSGSGSLAALSPRPGLGPPSSPMLRSPHPRSPGPPTPGSRGALVPQAPERPAVSEPKDFSFLLRPEIYHPLTPANVPQAFRNVPQQPAADTPLPALLAAGHFRAAAIVAAQQLTGTGGAVEDAVMDPTDHVRIFALLYTRLACLLLIDATSLAAQEGKALEDLNSSFYVDAATGAHLVPWALRVLNVRLQARGFGDPRRAVMSFYELAREARAQLAAARGRHDHSASELWRDRLEELGIKVAGALIEMDDVAGAAAHLASMTASRDRDGSSHSHSGAVGSASSRRIETAKALLWLHLGDVDAARASVQTLHVDDPVSSRVVSALCDMADDDYEAALPTWRELREDVPDDEMIGVNLAVCLLYVGKMEEGRVILESLVDSGYSSHTLLFNLSTMYELCSDRSRQLKLQLTQRVANMAPSGKGWEKVNADFKL